MKNNKNKNVNRIKSKEKAKVVAKPKGYYYSAANINKRKELQKKINNKNDIQADVNRMIVMKILESKKLKII